MKHLNWIVIATLFCGITFLRANPVPVLTISTSINPGTADYLMGEIGRADKIQAPYLILLLNTPGGLLSSTREITQAILNAKTPIVVFVSPQGAHAGSAGALITLAADVAAMAPGTNIGAAHPVAPGSEGDKVMEEKLANDTAAFAESLALAKKRNGNWAIKAVKKSASISSEEALKENVIDFIAADLVDLTTKLPGHVLKAPKGAIKALAPGSPDIQNRAISWKDRLVSFFADPNLAYLILTLGGLCLWIELSHPGMIVPGVVGAFAVILSLVSFQMLPIHFGALGLLLLGMAMLIAELFVTSYGVLGFSGIVAFVLGSIFLLDNQTSEFYLSKWIILPATFSLGLLFFVFSYVVIRTRKVKITTGREGMIGEYAEVREAVSAHDGRVMVRGELWNAISKTGDQIKAGVIVLVTDVREMVLVVTTVSNDKD